ncbi:hypothetical protein FC093_15530 [Ilyomonas limi]|uniref:Uncharacterized protein n=1 Tax=Ilyomonas limi TaxID=2575867 RepID=A0A4U3KWG1_9BACT|nr:hypothetical protein [Ilyomonas limi]TKK66911.1 hypothetical protein FC093_15530 [Ilyomonas limi]
MASFTTGNTANLNNFWTYLLSELHYKTNKPGTLVLKPAKNSLFTCFYKYDKANEQLAPGITVNLNCNRDGSNLQSTFITGSADLLNEIFVHYFGGVMKAITPEKGGFITTYTQTDEVRLFSDKIMIQPLHHVVSME